MARNIVALKAGCKECGKKIQARGLCGTHYSRLFRKGLINHRYAQGSVSERLQKLSKTNDKTGCVEWVSNKNKSGYGRLSINNKLWLAHRAAYIEKFGEISDGMHVCHKCDNPSCINPDHLFLGTDADNQADKVSKDRHLYGEKCPAARLQEREVLEIIADNRLQKEIAADYGVCKGTISAIKTGKNWSHL